MSRHPVRLTPLEPGELTDRQRQVLEGVGGVAAGASNIFATLVRHPSLMKRWLPFGGALLSGRLPGRERELLILRTAVHCGADSEWGQHVTIGLAAGLTQDEIDRVPAGPSAFEGFDAVLLTAADELHETSTVSDGTWSALAERYDEEQLIEVPMVVGHYHLVGYVLNAVGVQREPGVPDLPT